MADIKEQIVSYKVADREFEGFLALPSNAGTSKLPGVMLFHEWKGHGDYVRSRARMLAKLGYVAFAADLYGKGVYAKDHDEAGKLVGAFLSDTGNAKLRLEESLKQLATHANVDPKKIVAGGYCFGGACAISLAKTGADLAGVATFHASLKMGDNSPEAFSRIKAKLLICTGVDDPMIPHDEVFEWVKSAAAAKLDFQLLYLSGTQHSFTVPGTNFPGAMYNEASDRRSWNTLEYFLSEVFGKAKPAAALPTGPLALGK